MRTAASGLVRSYRAWSAVMGGWYLLGLASLIVHRPGAEAKVIGPRQVVSSVPAHRTYFENTGGAELTVVVLGLGALSLIGCAWFCWRRLRAAHLTMMVLVYAFGIGYFVSAVALHSAWSLSGFALAAAAGHILFARIGAMTAVVDALEDRG